jgi:molybdate transport system substrate-binding protein
LKQWIIIVVVAACSGKSAERVVHVAAASDLTRAFGELGPELQRRTGIRPIFDFGSSGMLAKQIADGAPYFLFAAANASYVDQVLASGRCDPKSVQRYARGRIVVWTPNGTERPTKLADLADPRFQHIAIANPDHAPYGVAAKQALEHAGLWSALQDRIVLADGVQAAMQYAHTRSVDAAIVAQSLAVVSDGGNSLAIDASLYAPLDQMLVVCGTGDEADAARQLVELIGSADGREMMSRYGFVLPDDQLHSSR